MKVSGFPIWKDFSSDKKWIGYTTLAHLVAEKCVIPRQMLISRDCHCFAKHREIGVDKMLYENLIYVGIDLHKETHTAVMIDCYNNKLDEITFANMPTDFPKLANTMTRHMLVELTKCV